MFRCRLTITHFPIFFVFLYLYFILSFHSTLSDFFILSSYLMFDLGSTSTLYSYLFDMSIPLSSLFMWGSLGSLLMMFSTHCISCTRGMGIISLGLLSLVSSCFFHPITLAYVTSHVLRPPWGRHFTHCTWQLTHGQYLRLVGDYFLKHDEWGAMIWFTLGHTPFIDDSFFWDDVLH